MSTDVRATPAIAAMDPSGLRYRGVDVRDLVGTVGFEVAWALLVDGHPGAALPPAEPFPLPIRTGDHRVDMQSALAQLAPVWGFRPLTDIDRAQLRQDLARASVMALSFLAQSARGADVPAIPQREVDDAGTLAGRFLMRWQGAVDPAREAAIDAVWVAMAADPACPSSRAARLVARTGADAAACLSAAVAASAGPRVAGKTARVIRLLEAVEAGADPDEAIRDAVARIPGLSEPTPVGEWPASDARASALHAVAVELDVPRLAAAERVADAARRWTTGHDATVQTSFWGAVLLDFAGAPARMFTALLACGRVAGWSAYIAEVHQKETA